MGLRLPKCYHKCAFYNETSTTRLFGFGYKRKIFVCIQDKKTGHIKIINNDKYEDDLLSLKNFPIILGTDDKGYFLTVISSQKLKKMNNNGMKKKIANDMVSVITSKTNELSNPILVKFKFSNF